MTAPRLEIDLDAIEDNTRTPGRPAGRRGIRVTAVTKAIARVPDGGHRDAARRRRGSATRGSRTSRARRGAGVTAPTPSSDRPCSARSTPSSARATSLNTEISVLEALSGVVPPGPTPRCRPHGRARRPPRGGAAWRPRRPGPVRARPARPGWPASGPTSPASTASSPIRPTWTSCPRSSRRGGGHGRRALGRLRRQLGQPGLGVGGHGPRPRRRAAARRGHPARPGSPHPVPVDRAAHRRRSPWSAR